MQIFFECLTLAIVFGNATNPHVLPTFDKVHNPLRLPRETTLECPKVVRTCGTLNILTLKCASRRYSVHFFDVSTSKRGPNMVCFVHFDLEMCLWGKLQNLCFSKVFKQVVVSSNILEISVVILRGKRSTSDVSHCLLYTPHSTHHTLHSTLYT